MGFCYSSGLPNPRVRQAAVPPSAVQCPKPPEFWPAKWPLRRRRVRFVKSTARPKPWGAKPRRRSFQFTLSARGTALYPACAETHLLSGFGADDQENEKAASSRDVRG